MKKAAMNGFALGALSMLAALVARADTSFFPNPDVGSLLGADAGPAFSTARHELRKWEDPAPVCECKGGGDMPGPFTGSNLRVELADGDVYALSGVVVFLSPGPGKRPAPFLRFDLQMHSWLANQRRAERPYYRLEGPSFFWREFEYETIRVQARARGQASVGSGGTIDYDLSLIPLAVYRIRD